MINLTKYFEKIYCINLDKRPDRYEKVTKEFDKFGMKDIKRYSAVDGSKMINNSTLLSGELGILETHFNIIKSCKELNIKNILLIEDDVYFTNDINNLDHYMEQVPKDWDLLYFGGNHIYGKPLVKINENIAKINYSFALQCIAINNSIYDKILTVLSDRKKQVDVYYAELQSVYNAYCFLPNIAKQTADYSDIQNRFVDYSYYFLD